MRRVIVALALALAAPHAARAGDADDLLGDARRDIERVDYEAAHEHVARALALGGLSAGNLAAAYRLAGDVSAAVGDSGAAEEHFVRWLVLDPRAALPAGASPKIRAPFAAAQRRVRELGTLSIAATLQRAGRRVRVTIESRDPLMMIDRLQVSDGERSEATREASVEIELGELAPATVSVVVLDARHNELLHRQLAVPPGDPQPEAVPEPAAARPTSHAWPTLVRWPTWTVVAAIGAGAGGWFAYQLRDDDAALDAIRADPGSSTLAEAETIADRGNRHAVAANVSFAIAGTAAVAAILTYVLEPEAPLEIAPALGRDSASVTARLRF